MTRRLALHEDSNFRLSAAALLLGAALACASTAHADDASGVDTSGVPSTHQLMKDCMAKQKASESGKTRADMRKACKDVTKNEKQNDQRAASDPQAGAQK
jgi:hypothetical protein